MPLWRTDPEAGPGRLDQAARVVGLILAVLGAVTVALLQFLLAVYWFEDRYQRDLARQGIVGGSEALNRAVAPAFWLTLAVVAVEVVAVVLLVRRRRRRARQ